MQWFSNCDPREQQRAAVLDAKWLQSCPTLCDPIDVSQPGSPIPGILQARTLEWVAISFSNAWKWNVNMKLLSCVWLFVTPWTSAHQAPPSMGFSRQEYWSGLPLPSPVLDENSLEMYILRIHPRSLSHKVCVVWVEPCRWCGWSPAVVGGGTRQLVLTRPAECTLKFRTTGTFFHMPV